MTAFTEDYKNLLIKQYWDQPKAVAEIEAKAARWEIFRDLMASFPTRFDLDAALTSGLLGLSDGSIFGLSNGNVLGIGSPSETSGQLDIIGRIIGLSRNQPDRLADPTYVKLLKVKIAQNNASAFMTSATRISIQDVIILAFDGYAIVTDNKDMTLTIAINTSTITPEIIKLIVYANLLPKPQCVNYNIVANTSGKLPFGMSEIGQANDGTALGLAELVYAPSVGGVLFEVYGD